MERVQSFRTETGSTYVFHRGDMTLMRVPDGDRINEWVQAGGHSEAPLVVTDYSAAPVLRRDLEPIPVLSFEEIVVGRPASFVLDILSNGVTTVRVTSLVVEVTDIGVTV